MKHLLVIDDEHGSRESLKAIFAPKYKCTTAASVAEARQKLREAAPDVIMLDVMMPDEDGLTFLKEVQNTYSEVPVIMVSGSTSVRPVVEAIRGGALDYVTKPFDVHEVRRIVERAIERSTMKRQLAALQNDISREFPTQGIIGESPAFKSVLEEVRRAAETESTVLIHGESGTGKELVARLLHNASARREEPFVAVHCGALPETLMESELFGHEKGAFTNADKKKPGRFELAGSGTLFFDEVSEMTLTTQVKLLRVIQEREYMRVGGTVVLRTNARIVAASNKNLIEEMTAKRFRDDLYYRLNVIPIHIPALRDRSEDIPVLATHFLQHFAGTMNVAAREFSPEAMHMLVTYRWPGNVRELRNIVERIAALHGRNTIIPPAAVPREFHTNGHAVSPSVPAGMSLEQSVDAFERHLVMNALKQANGVQTRAAELLGTTRRILKYRMVKLNIQDLEAAEVEN